MGHCRKQNGIFIPSYLFLPMYITYRLMRSSCHFRDVDDVAVSRFHGWLQRMIRQLPHWWFIYFESAWCLSPQPHSLSVSTDLTKRQFLKNIFLKSFSDWDQCYMGRWENYNYCQSIYGIVVLSDLLHQISV